MVRKARALARRHGWFRPRQFESEANAWVHRETTGPEILDALASESKKPVGFLTYDDDRERVVTCVVPPCMRSLNGLASTRSSGGRVASALLRPNLTDASQQLNASPVLLSRAAAAADHASPRGVGPRFGRPLRIRLTTQLRLLLRPLWWSGSPPCRTDWSPVPKCGLGHSGPSSPQHVTSYFG